MDESWRCLENGCDGTTFETHPLNKGSYCVQCGTIRSEILVANDAGRNFINGDSINTQLDDPRELNIQRALSKIRNFATQLHMSEQHVKMAYRTYRMASHMNFVHARKMDSVIGACLFLVTKEMNLAIMLIDISDAVRINVFEIGHDFQGLLRLLHLGCMTRVLDPSLLLRKYISRLNLGQMRLAIFQMATRITAHMNRDWISAGRHPAGICAAALEISCNIYNVDITRAQICKALRICVTTSKKRIEEFERTPSCLFDIDSISKKDNIDDVHSPNAVECDPPSFITNRIQDGSFREILLDAGVLDQNSDHSERRALTSTCTNRKRRKSDASSDHTENTYEKDIKTDCSLTVDKGKNLISSLKPGSLDPFDALKFIYTQHNTKNTNKNACSYSKHFENEDMLEGIQVELDAGLVEAESFIYPAFDSQKSGQNFDGKKDSANCSVDECSGSEKSCSDDFSDVSSDCYEIAHPLRNHTLKEEKRLKKLEAKAQANLIKKLHNILARVSENEENARENIIFEREHLLPVSEQARKSKLWLEINKSYLEKAKQNIDDKNSKPKRPYKSNRTEVAYKKPMDSFKAMAKSFELRAVNLDIISRALESEGDSSVKSRKSMLKRKHPVKLPCGDLSNFENESPDEILLSQAFRFFIDFLVGSESNNDDSNDEIEIVEKSDELIDTSIDNDSSSAGIESEDNLFGN